MGSNVFVLPYWKSALKDVKMLQGVQWVYCKHHIIESERRHDISKEEIKQAHMEIRYKVKLYHDIQV